MGKNRSVLVRTKAAAASSLPLVGRLFRYAVCLLVGLIPAGRGFPASQQAPLPSPPSFRVSVNLAQVDVIVTDEKGNRVSNLRADEFEVTEDGKRQKITNFEWIDLKPPRSLPAAGSDLKRAPLSDEIRRSVVLMIDDSGLWAEQEALPVITAARKFVNTQIAPGDLVSVTASRGGMGFYQQLTSDPRQLNEAIDQIARRPGFGRWTVAPPDVADENGSFVPLQLAPGEAAYNFRGGEPADPIGHLVWAIQGLRGLPGRKAVALFSHHFAAPESVIDLANRAGVAIYVIDAHGVDLTIAQRGMAMAVTGEVIPSDAPYRKLARDTGGLFLLSSPGANLTADLGRVIDDMAGYYLIGYRADRADSEFSGRPMRHIVQVKVLRKGLVVRARSGAIDSSTTNLASSRPLSTAKRLRDALVSPFNAGTIRLRLDTTYAASAPDPKTKLRRTVLHAMIVADGKDVRFTDVAPDKERVACSVLIAVFRQDGTAETSREKTFSFDLTPRDATELAASGLHGVMNVELPKPGPYQVRAAVRDENSGETGSAYLFVDVPDFNRSQIVLSNIQLSKPVNVSKAGAAEWDTYMTGTTVRFECQVFGFRAGSQPPRVDMQVRLFGSATDAPVVDSGLIAVPSSTLAENYLAGSLRIGSDFEPGDYTVQLLAYDRFAAPRKQVAAQWTHITVMRPAGN
jgi:VWFA-related protein